MGPAPTSFDNMLPGASSALFSIPKLADDGSNWLTYKERLQNAIGTQGMMRYVDGRVQQPAPFAMDSSNQKLLNADGKLATEAEIEVQDNKIDEWHQKN